MSTGTFVGEMEFQGQAIQLVLRVQPGVEGNQLVFLDVPQQGAQGIPLEISGDEEKIVLTAKAVGITITLDKFEETSLEGRFSQAGFNVDIAFNRVAETFDRLRREQEPKPPFPYTSKDVEFPGGTEGVTLHGTIVIPEGEGPFPGVALVSGTGPQDRDAMIMGHPIFLVIADHLARNGIASIRFDERGVGKSNGSQVTSTTLDFSKDVLNALALLNKEDKVDSNRVGIIGHSEGSTIAAMAAAESPSVKFVVSIAGPSRSYRDLLLYQLNKNFQAEGLVILANTAPEILGVIARQEPFEKVEKLITEALENETGERIGQIRPIVRAQTLVLFRNLNNPNGRYLLTIKPKEWFARVNVPVLILQGDVDVQVPREEAAGILAALPESTRKISVIEYLPANHLMQTTDDGSATLYGSLPETFSPQALRLITDFILALPKK
ncbi:MAG: alpha/beta hydrolase family protein [Fimbriimonadaceae bacterium]